MTEQELIALVSTPVKMPSAFRLFVNEKWMEHKDEVFNWENKFPEYNSTYYFRKHRWMLKKMFKEEQKEQTNV